MFAMRPARPDDVPAVAAVITARSAWMEDRGLPSWREAVDDLADQAAVDGTLMWVLTAEDQVIGCTTLACDKQPGAGHQSRPRRIRCTCSPPAHTRDGTTPSLDR
ncbi:MAG: hypothetical protein ACJ786_14930 [Catenulispora sp.]